MESLLKVSAALWPSALSLALQVVLCSTLVWAGMSLTRRTRAAWRHGVWLGVLAMAACLPLGFWLAPSWPLMTIELESSSARPAASRDDLGETDEPKDLGLSGHAQAATAVSPPPVESGRRPLTSLEQDPNRSWLDASKKAEPKNESETVGGARPPAIRTLKVAKEPEGKTGAAFTVAMKTRPSFRQSGELAVLLLWFAIALALIARRLFGEWRAQVMLAQTTTAGLAIKRVGYQLRRRVGVKRAVEWRQSSTLTSPALHGWRRPVVILPESLIAKFDEEAMIPLLLHELVHVRRRDALIQIFADMVVAVFWFAPGLWVARRGLRREREIITDAAVVKVLPCRSVYAEGIVRLLREEMTSTPPWRVSIGFADDGKEALMKRLDLILDGGGVDWMPLSGRRRLALLAMFFVVASALVGLKAVPSPARAGAAVPMAAEQEKDPYAFRLRISDQGSKFQIDGKVATIDKVVQKLRQSSARQFDLSGPPSPILIELDGAEPFAAVLRIMMLAARQALDPSLVDVRLLSFSAAPPSALSRGWGLTTLKSDSGDKDTRIRIRLTKADGKIVAEVDGRALVTGSLKEVQDALHGLGKSISVLRPHDPVVFDPRGLSALEVHCLAHGMKVGSGVTVLFAVRPDLDDDGRPGVSEKAAMAPSVLKTQRDRALAWLLAQQDATGVIAFADEKARDTSALQIGRHALALWTLQKSMGSKQDAGIASAVDKGLEFLKSVQQPDGRFTPTLGTASNYADALCVLTFLESYDGDDSEKWQDVLESGLSAIIESQNPYQAWRYGERDGDNDVSVTCWMMAALLRARDVGSEGMDDRALEWALSYLDSMTDPITGRTGYIKRGGSSIRQKSQLEAFPPRESEAMTAAAFVIRFDAKSVDKKTERLAQDLLLKRLPRWDLRRGSVDLYYWYWGTEAAVRMGGDFEKTWFRALGHALSGQQKNDGSFDPTGAWGSVGGRVYSTAMAALILNRLAEQKRR
ncbi:MAG: M56 family metallopeptidase [Planctomycetota bacterium]